VITRAIGILGMLTLFIGSLGIPMYEHYCTHEQLTIHTLFSASKHCDPELSGHKDVCCKPEKKQGIERKNCCSNELKNLSLTFDYFQQEKAKEVQLMAVLPATPCSDQPISSLPDDLRQLLEIEDPPPLSIHDRLPLIGCWRL
jgi:hypothetical protein